MSNLKDLIREIISETFDLEEVVKDTLKTLVVNQCEEFDYEEAIEYSVDGCLTITELIDEIIAEEVESLLE